LDAAAAVALLRFHSLGGLAVALVRRGRGELPDALLAELEADYHRTALHSTLVLESVLRARAALAGLGISSLLFKGSALLHDGTYGDPGERFMEDADLLVRPADAGAAVERLVAAGFRPWTDWHNERMTWLPAFAFTDPVVAPGLEVSLDLHWRTPYHDLRAGRAVGEDTLWDGADEDAGLPAPEPHFVVLAEHFLKHVRVVTHARGLVDLARLAPVLTDGERLARHARARGGLRSTRTAVALLREAFGVSPREEVDRALGGSGRLRGPAARVLAFPRLLDPDAARGRSRIEGLLARWATLGGPFSTARDLVQVAAPSPSWLRARYPHLKASALRARIRYLRDLLAWIVGRGVSPLSPNQEWLE
jgi:hypothetical protein